MPGQDERFDPTEFMTEAQLAAHKEAEAHRQAECRRLAEEAQELCAKVEEMTSLRALTVSPVERIDVDLLGTTIAGAVANLVGLLASHKAAVVAAVLEEREACAQIALGNQISETSLSAEWGRQCAAAIRRRSP